jgi:hypothetical protein
MISFKEFLKKNIIDSTQIPDENGEKTTTEIMRLLDDCEVEE